MQKILALDQGTSTGWAFCTQGFTGYGTKKFKHEYDGQVFSEFYDWLDNLAFKLKPDLIAFETPIHRGQNSQYLM